MAAQIYSSEQEEMIRNGNRNGLTLSQIERRPDFVKAGRKYEEQKQNAYKTWTPDMFLSGGNHGPFTSREQRENAFGIKVKNERGEWKLLYDMSENYRTAIEHKVAQTSPDIMGIQQAPAPKSLERQAQDRKSVV